MKMSFGRAMALAVVPALLLALGAGSASARPATVNSPPKGFEVDSASFVSAGTGFVLGARNCTKLPCTALLEKTVNGGTTWAALPAPGMKLVTPFMGMSASGVSEVRFENASDGWLFDPALWATTDGGLHWHRVHLAGDVIALAASDGVVFAVAQPAKGGFNAARLYMSQVGTAKWTRVPDVVPSSALTVYGHSVWAGLADGVTPNLWRSTDSGKHWTKLSFQCPSGALSASPVGAASAKDVVLACSDHSYPQPGMSVKDVYASTNGGSTFHLVGQPPEGGQVLQLAMPQGHPKYITMTAASGASFLYCSFSGGKTWYTTTYLDGGLSFRDLAYVSATTGYVVHFSGMPFLGYTLGLVKTVNAGRTWTTLTIP